MKVLRIVAAAYRDGWAFVEDGGRRLLVRPPYGRAPLEVPQSAVEQAVHSHGFDAEAREVASFRELVAFLEKRRVEIAEAEGRPRWPSRRGWSASCARRRVTSWRGTSIGSRAS